VGVATAGLAAQTPQTTTQTAQQSSAPSTEKITVTGCLKEAPASSAASTAVGTTGTAATAGAAGTAGATTQADAPAATTGETPKYVLADAVKSSAAAAGATTTAGETTAAGAAEPSTSSAPQTYRLIANMSALTPHVGKKLELVGTIEANPASSDTASASASMPALRVESGKIVAASCAP